MAKLSVNINKIATIRNARGENNPDLIAMALLIESAGADGITVHPRPDERHIRVSDVRELRKRLSVELNVEGYPSRDFISLMHEVRPTQITLVPDPPEVLTSSAGFKLEDDFDLVCESINALKNTGSRISIFIDPYDFSERDVSVIKKTGANRIELYTKKYADNPNCQDTIKAYQKLSRQVVQMGLGLNAGHDLSLLNLGPLLVAIPEINEVSIGHALICDALMEGMLSTVKRYLALAHLSG